jgi:hypothetical protein
LQDLSDANSKHRVSTAGQLFEGSIQTLPTLHTPPAQEQWVFANYLEEPEQKVHISFQGLDAPLSTWMEKKGIDSAWPA